MINLGGAVVPIVVSVVTVPLYLDAIGETRYGVLALTWLLLGYFGVVDIGLGRATANRIAQRQACPAKRRASVLWTALGLSVGLGLLAGLLVLAVGYVLLNNLLQLPETLRREAVAALPFLVAGIPFAFVASACVGALEGLERFMLVNGVEVVVTTTYQLGPLTLAYLHGPNLTWLLAAVGAAPVAGAFSGLLMCAPAVPLRRPVSFARGWARTLLGYGGWIGANGLIVPLLTMLDRFVIGAVSGARSVTQYTVPFSLVARLNVVPVSVSRALFPRLSRLESGEAKAVAGDAMLVLIASMTPMVIAAMILVEPFLRIWVGTDLGDISAPVAQIILIGLWINTLAFVPYTFLQARGRPDLPAKFHLAELPPYVVGLWAGIRFGGVEGAAWVWTLRATANAGLLMIVSRLAAHNSATLLVPAVMVALTSVAALVIDDSIWTLTLGSFLVVGSLVWAWRVAREEVRAWVPGSTR
jgi:O-antigen/teichoic acid export membrane protein